MSRAGLLHDFDSVEELFTEIRCEVDELDSCEQSLDNDPQHVLVQQDGDMRGVRAGDLDVIRTSRRGVAAVSGRRG